LVALIKKRLPPSQLARLVVNRMTLREKLGELVLRSSGRYENVNSGVPRLCIPRLTLQDGPGGLAYGDRGVTQLPAPLGMAASFDPGLAGLYGRVLGSEARGQGLDVVQGPTLNIDRVPQSGQGYTGFGEDALLVSGMGAAEIQGIQSQGVMADAKHLAVYSQETDRMATDDRVSEQALQEVYLAPFRAAAAAGVASYMCAYPELDGILQCQDSNLSRTVDQWGFHGFIRSDEGAVHSPVAALRSGTDLLKPASVSNLEAAVARGTLSEATVDHDVQQVLTEMFAHGIVGRPVAGSPGTPVDTAQHAEVALNVAQRSIVLLRYEHSVLPIDRSRVRSVAVIGAAASDAPVTGGHGSAQVIAPFVSTPLSALKSGLGPGVAVSYVDGGSTTRPLPAVPAAYLTPASGRGHGLTVTVRRGNAGTKLVATETILSARVSISREASTAAPVPRARLGAPPSVSQINIPKGPGPTTVLMTGSLQVPRTGLYALSITGSGPTSVSVGGSIVVDDWTNQGFHTWSGTAQLLAGRRYPVQLEWTPTASGMGTPSTLSVGMADVSPAIAEAVKAARSAQVAVVFAADYSGETFDRPTLNLPGDQNALIEAVASANPRTVVVLDTSGPVLMPWVSRVSSILEAWYPGEQDGAAISSVLLGAFDPSGHLPVTFPASDPRAVPIVSPRPGSSLVSTYSDGLAVGYRAYSRSVPPPLFPFGFGLSYTRFSITHLSITPNRAAVQVSVLVANTGHRSGGDVVQAYLTYPRAANEPASKLVAFRSITLAAARSGQLTMVIPWSRFQTYGPSGWTLLPGRYDLGVGDSSSSQGLHGSVDVPTPEARAA
jgi:beta-glucosidase